MMIGVKQSVCLLGFGIIWTVYFVPVMLQTILGVVYTGTVLDNTRRHTSCTSISSANNNNNISYTEYNINYTGPSNSSSSSTTTMVSHRAMFGLGHRLAKISCAYHLTKSLGLSQLQLEWKDDCEKGNNIVPKLFGSDIIHVPNTNNNNHNHNNISAASDTADTKKTIFVHNDVDGCYSGNTYHIHQVPISSRNITSFKDKLASDIELYTILRSKFIGMKDAIDFMNEHDFANKFVIGLHLRLGNGESHNFVEQGRGMSDEWSFVYNLIDLIRQFIDEVQDAYPERFLIDTTHHHSKNTRSTKRIVNEDGSEEVVVEEAEEECRQSMQQHKTPLIFLATDSPKFIPHLVNESGLPIVVMPQIRVESGVTFSALRGGGDKCVKGWNDMLLDSMIMSVSDVLIAARHSSFTQILPMPLVFDRGSANSGPHFCEVSDTAEEMTCLEDMETWMLRNNVNKTFNYAIHNKNSTTSANKGVPAQKNHIHYPDVVVSDHYNTATTFLDTSYKEKNRMIYGEKFSQKYRWKPKCPDCNSFNLV